MAENISVKVLTWEGILSVESAAQRKEELLSAFSQYQQVVISFSLLESIDLSILQLICAAVKEACKKDKIFHLTGALKPDLKRAFLISGLIKEDCQTAKDIEVQLFQLCGEAHR